MNRVVPARNGPPLRRLGVMTLAAALSLGPGVGAVAANALQPTPQGPRCTSEGQAGVVRETAGFQSGGRRLGGLLYRPRTPNGAGVVLLHGARGLAAAAPAFDPHAMSLASQGYHVLVPNYYDAHPPQEPRSSGALRRWRRAALDAVGFLGAMDGVSADRVALWGFSLGGFIAVEAAMQGEVPAAVAVAAGTDVGDPLGSRRDLPVLLIHGRRDSVISPASTRRWAADLRRRGAAVEVQELERDGHAFDPAGWCEAFDLTNAWLNRTWARRTRPDGP